MPRDHHSKRALAPMDKALRGSTPFVRQYSDIEAETRVLIHASRKLLNETAKLVENYKVTKTNLD